MTAAPRLGERSELERTGTTELPPGANLTDVVNDALNIVRPELGEPHPWTLDRQGATTSTTLRWDTPEGWEIQVELWFNDHSRGRGRRTDALMGSAPQNSIEGPWASVAVFRSDGFHLSGDGTRSGGHALQDLARIVHQVRVHGAEGAWREWYGQDDELDLSDPEDAS